MATEKQFQNRTKTVTRRLGWQSLKIGELLMGVRKARGLKKGEKVVKLHAITVINVSREPLNLINHEEVKMEGFPGMTPPEFVAMFCKLNGCQPDTMVTRIFFWHENS